MLKEIGASGATARPVGAVGCGEEIVVCPVRIDSRNATGGTVGREVCIVTHVTHMRNFAGYLYR